MRKTLVTAVVAAGLLGALLAPGPAGAISSYQSSPAPARTEVGAFVALWDGADADAEPDRFDWVCSGTMIDADTFLTAAHCTDDWPAGTHWYVSLDQDVQGWLDQAAALGLSGPAAASWALANHHVVEGTPHQDAAFPGSSSDAHDIAVLELSSAAAAVAGQTWGFTPARLPRAGQLTQLGGRTLDRLPWWAVGYGTEEALRGPGGHTHPGGGVRLQAPLGFNALNKTWVRLAMNRSRGFGGACYGDSGGPNFLEVDGRLLLVATTITGDGPCYATNVAYRLDSPSARAFLASYVALP